MVTITLVISTSIQSKGCSPRLPAVFISWACLYWCPHLGDWNRCLGVHGVHHLNYGLYRTLRWLFSAVWSDLSFRTVAQPPRLRLWLSLPAVLRAHGHHLCANTHPLWSGLLPLLFNGRPCILSCSPTVFLHKAAREIFSKNISNPTSSLGWFSGFPYRVY